MSVAIFNRCWARVILESIVRQGVQHICIAPGSRSTPLTLDAVRLQESRRVMCHTHFDERGLGFFALGLGIACSWRCAIWAGLLPSRISVLLSVTLRTKIAHVCDLTCLAEVASQR